MAIDPGPEQSAYVSWDGEKIDLCAISHNEDILDIVYYNIGLFKLVIEQVVSMGMPVGKDVFETVFWTGRFCEAMASEGHKFDRIPRHAVKMHLCGSMKAKDSNIRQALIDRFGKPGTKKNPGLTWGAVSKETSTTRAICAGNTELALEKARFSRRYRRGHIVGLSAEGVVVEHYDI